MFEDGLNESVIEVNEQYETKPAFWNWKLHIHRPFFSFPSHQRNKLLIWVLENFDPTKGMVGNMKYAPDRGRVVNIGLVRLTLHLEPIIFKWAFKEAL